MTVHPGSYCSPLGAAGETNTGTNMVCSVNPEKPRDRARWRRNGPKPAPRPRRARRARGSADNTPLPQVDAGINPNAVQHPVPEAADATAQKADLRGTAHESDRTGPDAVCTLCNLPAANGIHTNSARHPQWLAHQAMVKRAGGPKRDDESMDDYDARLNPFRDDDPAKVTENKPMTDDEIADKIRAAYGTEPGEWKKMKDIAAQTGLTPEELKRGVRKLMTDDPEFRADEEPFGHRVQDADRAVSPVIGGAQLHNMSFGAKGDPKLAGAHTTGAPTAAPVQQPAATPPAPSTPAAAPVDGHYTEKAPKPNNWGSTPNPDVHTLHYDGPLPRGVESLGQDARIDMGGEPLADTILDLGDQVRSGQLHPAELPERLAAVRDRLPKDSRAYRAVSQMAADVDAPMTSVPYIPENTPAPLKDLIIGLHRIPIVRQDPDRELNKVADLADRLAVGKIKRRDLETELYRMNRHEMWSDTGSIQINRMVRDTYDKLRSERRAR
jgi:hypothetical protein